MQQQDGKSSRVCQESRTQVLTGVTSQSWLKLALPSLEASVVS